MSESARRGVRPQPGLSSQLRIPGMPLTRSRRFTQTHPAPVACSMSMLANGAGLSLHTQQMVQYNKQKKTTLACVPSSASRRCCYLIVAIIVVFVGRCESTTKITKVTEQKLGQNSGYIKSALNENISS